MKFRRLTLDELKELQKEFVLFLATNSISADDWEMIKKGDVDKMDNLLDGFSDLVIERALQNMTCLKLSTTFELTVFKFDESLGKVIRLTINESSPLDLTNDQVITDFVSGKTPFAQHSAELFVGNKKLHNREVEIFELMQKGAVPCSTDYFEALYALVP